MRATRLLPPILAAATLLLLASNALPCIHHKQRLLQERERVAAQLRTEKSRGRELRALAFALQFDAFYVRRRLMEATGTLPPGVQTWPLPVAAPALAE